MEKREENVVRITYGFSEEEARVLREFIGNAPGALWAMMPNEDASALRKILSELGNDFALVVYHE